MLALSVSISTSSSPARHLVAVGLEPLEDRALLHGVGQTGHRDIGHGRKCTDQAAAATSRRPGRSRTAARGRARRAASSSRRMSRQRPVGDDAARRTGAPRARTAAAANGRSCVTSSIVRSSRVERLQQLAARARVQARRRLVEHEQPRVHRQHGRDRHAAALAERELVRRAVGDVLHPHGRQRATRPVASRRRTPRFSGPNATSSRTVGMNSWSSGSWNTRPTRARSSRTSPRADVDAGDLKRSRAASAGR